MHKMAALGAHIWCDTCGAGIGLRVRHACVSMARWRAMSWCTLVPLTQPAWQIGRRWAEPDCGGCRTSPARVFGTWCGEQAWPPPLGNVGRCKRWRTGPSCRALLQCVAVMRPAAWPYVPMVLSRLLAGSRCGQVWSGVASVRDCLASCLPDRLMAACVPRWLHFVQARMPGIDEAEELMKAPLDNLSKHCVPAHLPLIDCLVCVACLPPCVPLAALCASCSPLAFLLFASCTPLDVPLVCLCVPLICPPPVPHVGLM